MYALNSVPQHTARSKSVSSVHQNPPTPLKTSDAAQRLTCSLMAELSQMPNQPTSLPPVFIASFVRKCFAADLQLVDFPQALTGLDYLKDLEQRRCRELASAFERLGIKSDNVDVAESFLHTRYPAACAWLQSLEAQQRKIQALYTQVYIALRRWILINELSLVPYSKHNCIAMLNTIYPPVTSTQPTPQLTPALLKSQRDGFFKYIQAVEKSGPEILSNLIAQGQRPGEETGWPAVRDVLDRYLQTASSMIDASQQIMDINDTVNISAQEARRKADSGIDFLESRKSSTSSEKSVATPERPASRQHKSSTTLEKIAREFRHMRRKADVFEITPLEDTTATAVHVEVKDKSIRKMKSLSSISIRRQMTRTGSITDLSKKAPEFDLQKLNSQRKVFQAGMMAVGV